MSVRMKDVSYKDLCDTAKQNGWKMPSYEAWCLAVATDELRDLTTALNDSLSYVRTFLDNEIQTYEAKVQEEFNFQFLVEQSQSQTIQPQTSSDEIIEGISWSLFPVNGNYSGFEVACNNLIVALNIGGKQFTLLNGLNDATIANYPQGESKLGDTLTPLQIKTQSNEKRTLTVTATSAGAGTLPVNTGIYAVLWGYAVPNTQGRGLH